MKRRYREAFREAKDEEEDPPGPSPWPHEVHHCRNYDPEHGSPPFGLVKEPLPSQGVAEVAAVAVRQCWWSAEKEASVEAICSSDRPN